MFTDEQLATDPILKFFSYEHLPSHLQLISKLFAHTAEAIIMNCNRNPERTVALRKLLEAKDAAVRSNL